MFNEVVKESLNCGCTTKESEFSKKLKIGHQLTGTTTILDCRGKKQVYTVASYVTEDLVIIV